MRILLPAAMCLLMWGCAEEADVLTPYVQGVEPFQKYHKTFVQYRSYLKTEGMSSMAKDVRKVIENYKGDMEAIQLPKDKKIRAAHNSLVRTLENSLIKLVQPDFPTFVPSAMKQIKRIEKRVKVYNDQLKMQWERGGRTDPFPLVWPSE